LSLSSLISLTASFALKKVFAFYTIDWGTSETTYNITKQLSIKNAIDTVSFIYLYSVIYSDISPWNFLMAKDLFIKLCDFAGSGIGDLKLEYPNAEMLRSDFNHQLNGDNDLVEPTKSGFGIKSSLFASPLVALGLGISIAGSAIFWAYQKRIRR
ncbi:uncharacterized protein N7459_002603, partial [Penicillium hispanicum]|uniref:uncharacterized protein n=1 Tax=Penicillium hispanicum TaxID=1080232 RepID=UPI0025420046